MATSDDSRIGKLARRSQTCDICKARHQMCNGVRPRCNNCDQRNLNCSYSVAQARGSERPLPINKSPQSDSVFLNAANGRLAISDVQYAHLRDQLLDDILRGFYSKDTDTPRTTQSAPFEDHKADANRTEVGNASLPSFHQQTHNLIQACISVNMQSEVRRDKAKFFTNNDKMEDPLTLKTHHVQKILRNSLPAREASQRLLEAFLNYQNSVFYVCERNDVQEQLNLMYKSTEHVSIAWFCQMFLIFAIGAQFDDFGEEDSATYYEIGRKYMDEALEEDPENSLWVIRAMLLICFYQPPTKWTTLWMYLDTAIRKAQRYRLDLGQNSSDGLTDDEHQEWRQLWLTLISFDRWVATFLGRLPHIKESISRDPIFKVDQFRQGLNHYTLQNNITSLAIIMGYILRDMYISEQPNYFLFQKYKGQLETWLRSLSGPLQQYVKSGLIDKDSVPRDQYEAMFNLFFMNLGAWMFLTKPMLSEIVTARNIAVDPSSSSTLPRPKQSAEGNECVQCAIRLITSSSTLLAIPKSPRRLFMPVFFLVYAAHVVILGLAETLWAQADRSLGVSHDQSIQTAALDTAVRVLDFCGQRNPFARKYSLLIKELWSQLKKAFSGIERVLVTPPSIGSSPAPRNSSQTTTTEDTSSSRYAFNAVLGGSTSLSSCAYAVSENEIGQQIEPNQILQNANFLPTGNLDRQSFDLAWPESFEDSNRTADWFFPEAPPVLRNSDKIGFQEHIWE